MTKPGVKRLSHRVAARADLADIWRYTARVWGTDQADRYLTQLDEIARGLADGTVRGARAHAGHRKQSAASHILYYRETAEDIDIVRVLHARMDFARHLPD